MTGVQTCALPIFRTSQDGDAFARHIRDIHEKVQEKIKINNENYKEAADAHRRYIQFQEGDLVTRKISSKHISKASS